MDLRNLHILHAGEGQDIISIETLVFGLVCLDFLNVNPLWYLQSHGIDIFKDAMNLTSN